jgi:glutathione synthase/RimK-type ligase-like ATP-grasp enzyme
MRLYITPYNMGSESARDLAHGLQCLRVDASKRLRDSVVINWGRSDLVVRGRVRRVINKPEAVRRAANKIETFRTLSMAGVPTVDWTTDRSVAMGWLDNDLVYCRTIATGSQGVGIVVVGQDDLTMPYAPLYTKGFNKTHEYRVHVAFGRVIDYSKKKRRDGVTGSSYIKNSANGWVFCRDGVDLPSEVASASIKAVAALGLDFGALDVLYKERDDKAAILEVNTSPGIEGSTLQRYIETFRGVMHG